MRARSLLLATAALFALALAAPAYADDAHAEIAWGDDIQVMDEAEMADLRGGLRVDGMEIGFGAVVTTYANGVRALETQLTWTNTGAIVSQTMGSLGQRIDDLSPEQRTTLGLDGLAGLGGVVIDDADGVTALAHNITNGALQNIIINSATGRDLHQDVDLTLTLPDFEGMQQAINADLAGLRIAADLRDQLAGAD